MEGVGLAGAGSTSGTLSAAAPVRSAVAGRTREDELSARLARHEEDLAAAKRELSAKFLRHAEELGKFQGLRAHWDAVLMRHDTLAQLVASHRVEGARRADELAASADALRRSHAALEEQTGEQAQAATRRADELAAAQRELKNDLGSALAGLRTGAGDRFATLEGRVAALDRRVETCFERSGELTARLERLEGTAEALRQRLEKGLSDRLVAEEALTNLLAAEAGRLKARLRDQDGAIRERTRAVEDACRDALAEHREATEEATRSVSERTDQQALALRDAFCDGLRQSLREAQQAQRALGGELAESEAEAARRQGAVDGALEQLRSSCGRLPAMEARHAALSVRLDDLGADARARLEEHAECSRAQLEKHAARHGEAVLRSAARLEEQLAAHAKSADSRLEQAVAALHRRAESFEQELGEKLDAATRHMERIVEAEAGQARQLVAKVLGEVHEDLVSLRAPEKRQPSPALATPPMRGVAMLRPGAAGAAGSRRGSTASERVGPAWH
eukprot:TRINITY_DN21077_c0_g1_i1.p1 TRINITY_DN21077_c0_g1~~TRINITY_DN21077_c0_g1_i1.p1  ORF type:complete len:508 (-),score=170.88 TRINITY_DN21077_c0_g1_i1:4-1527(-)